MENSAVPLRRFQIPTEVDVYAMVNDQGTLLLPPRRQQQQQQQQREDHLRSSGGNSLLPMQSEDSRPPIFGADDSNMRSGFDQDRKLVAPATSTENSNGAPQEQDAWPRDEQPRPAAASSSSSSSSSRGIPVGDNIGFVKNFRYMVEGPGKRVRAQVMELAPEYSLEQAPDRILVARHVRRPPMPPRFSAQLHAQQLAQKLSEFTYEFSIYTSIAPLLYHLRTLPPERRTLFAVVEQNGSCFAYFDLEVPVEYVEARIHGASALNLFGYCMAMVRATMSLVLGVNVSCFSRSYIVYESRDPKKWSAHVHVAWPFRMIDDIRAVMGAVKELLWEMYNAGLDAVAPLFYFHSARDEYMCAIDMGVFTKKRNFRLPECTKCGRQTPLTLANDCVPEWNQFPRSPCAVDLSVPDNRLTPGMVLCRNSRAFWTPITISSDSALLRTKPPPGVYPASREHDFRCLPTIGQAKAYADRVRVMYRGGAGGVWINPNDRAQVNDKLDELWKHLYHQPDELFTLLFRLAASATDSLNRLYSNVLHHSAERFALFALLWPRAYRPGLGLDQRLNINTRTLDFVIDAVERLHTLLQAKNRGGACLRMLQIHMELDTFLSTNCTGPQLKQRREFLTALAKDFVSEYYTKHVDTNAYTRDHFLNPFVLDALAQRLMLASGAYVHSMQLSTVPPDSAPPPMLHQTPAGYGRPVLQRMYEYCFRAACKQEGKADAPTLARVLGPVAYAAARPTPLLPSQQQQLMAQLRSLWETERAGAAEDDAPIEYTASAFP